MIRLNRVGDSHGTYISTASFLFLPQIATYLTIFNSATSMAFTDSILEVGYDLLDRVLIYAL